VFFKTSRKVEIHADNLHLFLGDKHLWKAEKMMSERSAKRFCADAALSTLTPDTEGKLYEVGFSIKPPVERKKLEKPDGVTLRRLVPRAMEHLHDTTSIGNIEIQITSGPCRNFWLNSEQIRRLADDPRFT
jgi:hypothetical protein